MYYLPTEIKKDVDITRFYTIHYFEYDKNYSFAGESHDFWELLYIDRGNAVTSLNGASLPMSGGQMILYEPGAFHTIAGDGHNSLNTIVVSFDCRAEGLESLKNKIFFAGEVERAVMAQVISEAKLAFCTDLGDPKYRRLELREKVPCGSLQLIQAGLEAMFISLIRREMLPVRRASAATIEQKNRNSEKYLEAVEYIGRNLDKPLTLEKIARGIAVSVSCLEGLFKKYAAVSPMRYCRRKKIEAAKRMIREGKTNFTRISESLGFSSLQYFSKTFLQIEGMPPSEYAVSIKAMVDHSGDVKGWSEK